MKNLLKTRTYRERAQPAAQRAAQVAEPVPQKLGPRRALESGFVRSPVFDD